MIDIATLALTDLRRYMVLPLNKRRQPMCRGHMKLAKAVGDACWGLYHQPVFQRYRGERSEYSMPQVNHWAQHQPEWGGWSIIPITYLLLMADQDAIHPPPPSELLPAQINQTPGGGFHWLFPHPYPNDRTRNFNISADEARRRGIPEIKATVPVPLAGSIRQDDKYPEARHYVNMNPDIKTAAEQLAAIL